MKNFEESLAALDGIEHRAAKAQEASKDYRALLSAELAVLIAEEAAKSKTGKTATEFFDEMLDRFPQISPAILAIDLTEKLQKSKKNKDILDQFGSIPEKSISVCHPKNRFIQKAADLCPRDTRFFYAENYEDAAARVATGENNACILPYIAPNGDILPGIARLIEEQGLCKTALIFAEHDEDGEAGYLLLTATPIYRDDATRLELTVYPPNRLNFFELALFSAKLGISPAFPKAFSENEEANFSGSCVLTFTGTPEKLKTAAEAIRFLCPENSITGFYKIIKP